MGTHPEAAQAVCIGLYRPRARQYTSLHIDYKAILHTSSTIPILIYHYFPKACFMLSGIVRYRQISPNGRSHPAAISTLDRAGSLETSTRVQTTNLEISMTVQ